MFKSPKFAAAGAAVVILQLFVAVGANAPMRNIIRNPDLSMPDGLGGEKAAVGWRPFAKGVSSCSGRNCGEGAFEVLFEGGDPCHFRQSPISLKPSGRYRLRAEVQTDGLNGARCHVHLWDNGPQSDVVDLRIPERTNGKWVELSQEGVASVNSSPGGCSVNVSGSSGDANHIVKFRIRNLSLVALDAETDAATSGIPDVYLEPLKARIVPIDPLLANVSAENAEVLFYWSGDLTCGHAPYSIVGSVDGGAEARAALGEDARARLSFGRIAKGEHRMRVRVLDADGKTVCEDGYRFRTGAVLPDGPQGRRLNNFATELVAARLENGVVRFFRPEDGWVWISFDEANEEATGVLDDERTAIVRKREGEAYLYGVRNVKAGWHTLKVAGARRGGLRIHATKVAAQCTWSPFQDACDFSKSQYQYSFAFARRFFLPGMNVFSGASRITKEPRQFKALLETYGERGLEMFGDARIKSSSSLWFDAEGQMKVFTEGDWSLGCHVSIDESSIGALRKQHAILTETLWTLYDRAPERRVNVYWGDAVRAAFDDPKVHIPLLSAIANTGWGKGASLPENYAAVLDDEEAVKRNWFGLFVRNPRSVKELVPGAKENTIFCVSPYIDVGDWCDYPCPAADAKALWSRMMRLFATDASCMVAGGLAGGGAACCEEELRRWHARLMRYYVFEGGTEDLADKYGFLWTPGFVRNCDFAEGLEGWTVQPAEGGSVRADRIDKYGVNIQRRNKVAAGVGDTVAEFVSDRHGTNRISQVVSGLIPGKFYSLLYCTADTANVAGTSDRASAYWIRARLEGAEEVRGLQFVHVRINKRARSGKKIHLKTCRYVFRATASEATLVFEDGPIEGRKAADGKSQILNYIVFRPYYVESDSEAEEIAALMRQPK